MSKKNDMTGAIYFFNDAPHVVGHFRIAGVDYQITGLRCSPIKTELRAHRANEKQTDLFEDDNGRS